jgi:hypothetical protein
MNRSPYLALATCTIIVCMAGAQQSPLRDIPFSDSWKFYRGDATGAEIATFSDNAWETVCLPHTARIESAKTHTNWDYYKGYYWYRKSFTPDTAFRGKKIFLEIEAGMQTTQVWINGTGKITFGGGYSPFTLDITNNILLNQTNVIAMRLNNAADPNVPPGAEQRDFYYYGGLYRYVKLHVVDSLHITDAVYANLPASGGVFVTYPAATAASATVRVKTHITNEYTVSKSCVLTTTVLDSSGGEVQTLSTAKTLAAGANDTFVQTFTVANPRLWSPSAPNLYTVRSRVFDTTRAADEMRTTIGIRRIRFSRDSGFQINGIRMKSKGMNRHQDYGAIGGAVPVSGQYRDALRMKEAGINFVRLSHYIQHPSFLDACDKLGITVQACMPGWQYNGFSNTIFVNNSVRDLRTMIRYYRNHPCVIMWESVHNESAPPASFAAVTQAAAHEEFQGDQMYTCGQDASGSCGTLLNIMDVYQAAVQQCGRTTLSTKPQAISEYGHWEWGGFDYGGTSSNQPRAIGETGMLTLAGNQASAMSQDHALSWLSVDALWVYNETFGFSNYNNSLCGGGIVDVFRIPKFGYYFYQSQRDTQMVRIPGAVVSSGPMVYIANFWMASSSLTARVYSNCPQVRLSLNGTAIATQSPGTLANIDHPPFTFTIPSFQPGTLLAEGLIGGVVRATHQVRTPGDAAKVQIAIDTATMPLVADGADLAIVYGSIVDADGTVLPTAVNPVTFSVTGPGAIISGDGNPVTAVAGIAAVYVQTKYATPGLITVTGAASGLTQGSATVRSIAMPAGPNTAVAEKPSPYRSVPATLQGFSIVGSGRTVTLRLSMLPDAGPQSARFSLFDPQGRLVRRWELRFDRTMSIDLSGCGSGVYYGKLVLKNRSYGARVVVTE